jgi:hypothetical protein
MAEKARSSLVLAGLALVTAVGLIYLFGRNGRHFRLD